MPYINVDFSFTEHPKTKRLIGRLGECAEAYIIRLWTYCARVHPKDGRLNGYAESEIEGVIGWRGAQNSAISALVDIGFIGKDEGGYFCVDWLQHQGHIISFSRRGKANAKKRWKGYASGIPTSNAKSESGNAPTLPTIPTKPKPTIPPDLESVKSYCLERNNGIDPQAFIDFYEARGWAIGKNKMKSWEAAVRTWERNAKNAPVKPLQSNDPYAGWQRTK